MAERGTLDGDAGNGFAPGQQDDAVGGLIISIVKIVVAVLFAPAAIVCILTYSLFRRVRLKFSMVSGAAIIVTLVGLLYALSSRPWLNVSNYLSDNAFNPSMVADWTKGLGLSVLPLWIDFGLIVGPAIGVLMTWRQMRLISKNPWLVLTEGEDYYGFKFRLSPLEILKKNETIKKIKADSLVPFGDKTLTPLGMEDEPMNIPDDPAKLKRYQVISRGEKEAPMHTLITGAAGAGKSKTMLSIMLRDIKRGNTVICIDNKNSPDLACSVAHMAKQYGRNFMHFSVTTPYPVLENPEGPCSYDPLAYGSVAKKTDMVLGMREWDTNAAVYREQAQSYLSVVFATIDEARRLGVLDKIPNLDTSQGELWTFMQCLDRSVFNALVVAMNKFPEASYIRQQASDLNAKLSSTGRKSNEAQAAIHSQMSYQASFSGLMATYGDRLRKSEDSRMIDIMKASAEPNNVILFSLDASKQGDRGSELGALICQDLTNMTEMRPNLGQTNPVSIYIDEFQSLPPTCVASMLQKARASKVGLTLAFQSLDQVVAATDGKDAYVKGLLDTCSNFIFHAGSNYDTGEMAAKIIGKRKITRWIVPRLKSMRWLNSWWTTDDSGVATAAMDEEWILDPSEFAKLSMPNAQNHFKSEAIVIKKVSSDPVDRGTVGAIAHKVQMIPPNEVLEEFYDPKEFIARGGNAASLAAGSSTIDVPSEIMQSGPVSNAGNVAVMPETMQTSNVLTMEQPTPAGGPRRPGGTVPRLKVPIQESQPATPARQPEPLPSLSAADMEEELGYVPTPQRQSDEDNWAEVRRLRQQAAGRRTAIPSQNGQSNSRPTPRVQQQSALPGPSLSLPMPDFESDYESMESSQSTPRPQQRSQMQKSQQTSRRQMNPNVRQQRSAVQTPRQQPVQSGARAPQQQPRQTQAQRSNVQTRMANNPRVNASRLRDNTVPSSQQNPQQLPKTRRRGPHRPVTLNDLES